VIFCSFRFKICANFLLRPSLYQQLEFDSSDGSDAGSRAKGEAKQQRQLQASGSQTHQGGLQSWLDFEESRIGQLGCDTDPLCELKVTKVGD
jgi:hypothetical protein